jgi:RNA polymerase sigma-70 factor (sigma-E family)
LNSDRNGDDAEFRGFMAHRWPSLLRTAYLLTGSHHDAEDLAQSALAKAYAKWDRVRASDDPAAYVRKILVHTHADRYRKLRVREWLTGRLPDHPVQDPAALADDRAALVQALSRLPARQRAAVVLCYFEDMTHAQVAVVLGTRPGTVRGQISRALTKLREDGVLAHERTGEPRTKENTQ